MKIRPLAATVLATGVLALAGGATGASASGGADPQLAMKKVVTLHESMDKLWTDHVTWTRLVIIDFFSGLPSLKSDLARLLHNQVEIGNAIKPFYGSAAGSNLTALLRTHIMQAVPVLAAAKNGDNAGLKQALANWYANAHQIAAFLSKANPLSWPLTATRKMMDDHLKLTTNEAVAQLKGQWRASIALYDKVRAEILMMADALADGLVKQFPARFA